MSRFAEGGAPSACPRPDRHFRSGRTPGERSERCGNGAPSHAIDMGGNVAELVVGFAEAKGVTHVAKGGSFQRRAVIAARNVVTVRALDVGFRCARSVGP